MKKLNPSASTMGSFTDFNVWRSALSEEKMMDFTRCRSVMAGDLIPWNKEDWTFTQGIGPEEFRGETVDFNSMCSPQVIREVITIQLLVLIFRKGCHYFLSDMELMEVWSSVRDLEGLWPSQSDDIMQIYPD